MNRPAMRITGPVLDTADPTGLAKFYERLLGRAIVELKGRFRADPHGVDGPAAPPRPPLIAGIHLGKHDRYAQLIVIVRRSSSPGSRRV